MNSIHNFWSPGGVLAMAVGDQMNMFDQSYPQTKQTCMTCFMLDESVSNSLNKHSNKAIHAQIGLFKRQLDHTCLIVYGPSNVLNHLPLKVKPKIFLVGGLAGLFFLKLSLNKIWYT